MPKKKSGRKKGKKKAGKKQENSAGNPPASGPSEGSVAPAKALDKSALLLRLRERIDQTAKGITLVFPLQAFGSSPIHSDAVFYWYGVLKEAHAEVAARLKRQPVGLSKVREFIVRYLDRHQGEEEASALSKIQMKHSTDVIKKAKECLLGCLREGVGKVCLLGDLPENFCDYHMPSLIKKLARLNSLRDKRNINAILAQKDQRFKLGLEGYLALPEAMRNIGNCEECAASLYASLIANPIKGVQNLEVVSLEDTRYPDAQIAHCAVRAKLTATGEHYYLCSWYNALVPENKMDQTPEEQEKYSWFSADHNRLKETAKPKVPHEWSPLPPQEKGSFQEEALKIYPLTEAGESADSNVSSGEAEGLCKCGLFSKGEGAQFNPSPSPSLGLKK